MMLAPSASSTSALPDFDDTERLPCLATRAPAAAATNIDAVEMLNVCDASPPVPTMSSRFVGIGDVDLGRELAHHLRRRGDLADRLLLDAQADGQRGDHHRRHLAAHDPPHQRQHLVVEDLAMLDRALQRVLKRDGHGVRIGVARVPARSARCVRPRSLNGRARKFSSTFLPCSVRIASGWNCTPSTGSSRWRTRHDLAVVRRRGDVEHARAGSRARSRASDSASH